MAIDIRKYLYTPEEAADALSVSRSKLFELIGTGRLRSVLVDRSRRIPQAALEEFVDGLEVEATA